MLLQRLRMGYSVGVGPPTAAGIEEYKDDLTAPDVPKLSPTFYVSG